MLSSQLVRDGWEDPLPEFRAAASAVGHVHVAPDADAVVRGISLAKLDAKGKRPAVGHLAGGFPSEPQQ